MSVRRPEPRFWSSCCGALAAYIGYYKCTGCQKALSMGRTQEPHLISSDGEAARIRQEQTAGDEVSVSGRLF